MTIIIITHNAALTAMADRVIKVKNGTVSEADVRRCCINVVKSILNSQTQKEYMK